MEWSTIHRRASYDKKTILPCKSGTCVEFNFYCCCATLSVLAAVVCVSTALILFAAVNMVCSLWKLPVEGSPRLVVSHIFRERCWWWVTTFGLLMTSLSLIIPRSGLVPKMVTLVIYLLLPRPCTLFGSSGQTIVNSTIYFIIIYATLFSIFIIILF